MGEVKTATQGAFDFMKEAFELLKADQQNTREKSLVITNLEQAMMWLNKHRAMIGELEKKSDTHVE